ncbi:MAG: anti-sigma factor family protein [Candidatus Cyclobacteriaceae bacterium M3_2C_046]
MNYKPDHQTFMDYLYQELDQPERERFEQYMATHPEAQAELDQLKQTSQMLQQVESRQVNQPLILEKAQTSNLSRFYKKTATWAAAIVLIMVVLGLSNFRASYQSGTLQLSFGPQSPINNVDTVRLKPDEKLIAQMVAQAIQPSQDSLYQSLLDRQNDLSRQIQQVDNSYRQSNQAAMIALIQDLNQQNFQQLTGLIMQANQDQKDYAESLLTDFSGYLNEQRKNDLQLIEYALNRLQENTEVRQQETAFMLTQLYSKLNQQEN